MALCAASACTLSPEEPLAPPPRIASLSIEPAEAVVQPGGSVGFRATVKGTGAVPQGVRWAVECLECDPSSLRRFSIDAPGLLTVEARPEPTPMVLRVSAVSTADATVSGSVRVQVPALSLRIEPATADVPLGGEAQFQVTLDGTLERPTLSALWGEVDGDGRYHAPARAGSSRDAVFARWFGVARLEAAAEVRLLIPPPVLSATSGPAAPGDLLTLFGTGLDAGFPPGSGTAGTVVEAVFPDAAGGEVPALPGSFADVRPDRLTVTVPPGAAAGPLLVRMTTAGSPVVRSNAIPFERGVRLRVHAAEAEIAAGETTRIDVAVLGGVASLPLTFETDLGSVSGGVYAAPAEVAVPSRANVRVCIDGTTSCSGATVTVRPFLVSPSPAVVAPGASLSFSARRAGAPIPATFALGSGGGTITPGGTFTAPVAVEDSGASWLLAADGSGVSAIQVGIAGLSPGLLARAEADAGDPAAPLRAGVPWGASARSVEIAGAHAWVSAGPVTGTPYHWLDAYDLSDPLKPVWLGAVEAAGPAELKLAHGRVYAVSTASSAAGVSHRVEVFDVSGALPRLVASSTTRSSMERFFGPPVVDAENLYEFGDPDLATGAVPVAIRRLADGPLAAPRHVVLGPAPGADAPQRPGFGLAATARDGRAWNTYRTLDLRSAVAAWDLAADPPALLGTSTLPFTTSFLRVAGPLLLTAGCFDRRPSSPVQVACGGSAAVAEDGNRVVWSLGGALALVDHEDSLAPVRGGAVFGGSSAGRLVGNRFHSAEGPGGLAVYDLAPDGGPRLGASVQPAQPVGSIAGKATAGTFLYTTGRATFLDGYVAAWDLSATPPALVGHARFAKPGLGLALAGDALALATAGELQVWSLADPAHPSLAGTLPIDATAVAADGSLAFAGTAAGEVVVVDLTAPAAPVELGRVAARSGVPARALARVAPGLLAAGFGGFPVRDGGLALIDVSVPGSPLVVSLAGAGTPVLDLAVGGGAAFLTTPASLAIWSLADPAAPAAVATVSLPAIDPLDLGSGLRPTRRITVSDGLAWISGVPDGSLLGLDVRAPAWPRLVSRASLAAEIPLGQGTAVVDGARAYFLSEPFSSSAVWSEVDLSRPRNVVLTERPAPDAPPGVTLPE